MQGGQTDEMRIRKWDEAVAVTKRKEWYLKWNEGKFHIMAGRFS